jgi:hypothetical protein
MQLNKEFGFGIESRYTSRIAAGSAKLVEMRNPC